MIIKKPYAFIAKHYKIINLLLLIPTVYLLLQMTEVASFFGNYVAADYSTQEKDLVDIYIPAITLIAPLITAILHIFVWIILTLKKKKNYYHIVSAGYHLFIFLALVLFYTSMLNIEMSALESTFARFLRDTSELCIYPIYLLIAMGAINVIGFNIKTLRLDKHQDLKVTDEDEEEIEVKVGNDNHDTKRRIVHTIRELKYYVAENKIIIGIIILLIALMVGYRAFLHYQVYNQNIRNNQAFGLDSFALSVKDSYISKVDFRGRVITEDKYYLAVKIGIHNKGEETKLDKSVFRIVVSGKTIFPSYEKSTRFIDIGTAYQGEIIKTDQAKDYVFIYELTEKQLKEKYELRILNDIRIKKSKLVASYKKINLRPEYLTKLKKNPTKKVGDKIKLDSTTLKGTSYRLNKVRIESHYNYTYEVCETPRNCYTNQDTIVPTGGKVLMVVDDNITYDETSAYYEFLDKNFYEDFITLEYTFDIKSGKNAGTVTQIGNVVDITPAALEGVRVYEVPTNVMNSYKLNLILMIRNQVFTIKVLD